MQIIRHRRNSIADLESTPQRFGVEIDLRSHSQHLILNHDAFAEGESAESWLEHYRHGTLILNVKEEGLEERLIALMQEWNIVDYFFLDQSFPFLVKYALAGHTRAAVRISEYESIETAMSLKGMVDWVWVDSFKRMSFTYGELQALQGAGFKLCLVSPELQGRNAESEVPLWRGEFDRSGFAPDAVCTKRPDLWESVA